MNEETLADVTNYDQVEQKLPSGLNVLTILTFIGCAFWGLITMLTPVIYNFFKNITDKALSSGKELSAKQLADIEKGKAAMDLAVQHMIPSMVIGMVGIILCFVGALWMRKYKKDGYWIYVAGELAPIIGGFLLMGTAQFTGVMSVLFAVGIPVLFVILYTMQRKYLTK
jgi:hypothetical protein